MKQMGIKAQWVKPYTITTKDPDFSSELQNILNKTLTENARMVFGVLILPNIWTIDVFVYLTSIMDLYSRKIIDSAFRSWESVCLQRIQKSYRKYAPQLF